MNNENNNDYLVPVQEDENKPVLQEVKDTPINLEQDNISKENNVNSSANMVMEEIKEVSSNVKEEFEKSFKGFFKYVTTRDTVDLFKLIIRLLLIVVIIAIFYFPFSLIKDMGISLLTLIGIKISDAVLNVWYFICDFGYGIFGLVAFYKIVSTRYENLIEKKIIDDEVKNKDDQK